MHSGILRSAFQTPFQLMGCGGVQRKFCTGGLANGIPNHAFTPDGRTLPATAPSEVRIGAMGVSTICARKGDATVMAATKMEEIVFIGDLMGITTSCAGRT